MKTYTTGHAQRNCPVFGCGSSNLAKLSNHQERNQMNHHEERKKWLKWSKIRICVPLKDKDANEKKVHLANTLETLVNLQGEMATNFNNFLTVQRTHRKSTRTKQTC